MCSTEVNRGAKRLSGLVLAMDSVAKRVGQSQKGLKASPSVCNRPPLSAIHAQRGHVGHSPVFSVHLSLSLLCMCVGELREGGHGNRYRQTTTLPSFAHSQPCCLRIKPIRACRMYEIYVSRRVRGQYRDVWAPYDQPFGWSL